MKTTEIIARARTLQDVSTEEHPCDSASAAERNNFRAVGAAREALDEASIPLRERVFEACCDKECAAAILKDYFESLADD